MMDLALARNGLPYFAPGISISNRASHEEQFALHRRGGA